jgi:hypothetical protein
MPLKTVAAKVDAKVHQKLRSMLLNGKLPEKNWTQWLRHKEWESVQLKKLEKLKK